MILTRLKQYCLKALKGECNIEDEYVEYFGNLCKEALTKYFRPRDNTFRLRMSQIGKNLREQQGELLKLPKDEENEYNLAIKFIYGDLCEALLMTLMKASGVPIQDEQKDVKLDIAGITLEGTYDVKINNKIYDIKSCSPYSFSSKFERGFQTVEQLDSFGYTTQLYLYSQSDSARVGGWVVLNKVTGGILVVEPPTIDDLYKTKHLKLAENNIKKLLSTTSLDDIDKELPLESELFRGKPTGKQVLAYDYNFFPFKKILWGSKLEYKPNSTSKAKIKAFKWYKK